MLLFITLFVRLGTIVPLQDRIAHSGIIDFIGFSGWKRDFTPPNIYYFYTLADTR